MKKSAQIYKIDDALVRHPPIYISFLDDWLVRHLPGKVLRNSYYDEYFVLSINKYLDMQQDHYNIISSNLFVI